MKKVWEKSVGWKTIKSAKSPHCWLRKESFEAVDDQKRQGKFDEELAVAACWGPGFLSSVANRQAGFAGGLAIKSVISARFARLCEIFGFGAFWRLKKRSETTK